MKKICLAFFLFAVSCSAAFGCTCVSLDGAGQTLPDQVSSAVKDADAVFLGNVDRFDFISGFPSEIMEKRRESIPGLTWETKTVVFDVDLWWKGPLDAETFIATSETRNSDGTRSSSSCDYAFEEGKTYLVFARKSGEFLRNIACGMTRNEENMKEVLPLLGEGKKPLKRKPQG
jgi:hypothetical protein